MRCTCPACPVPKMSFCLCACLPLLATNHSCNSRPLPVPCPQNYNLQQQGGQHPLMARFRALHEMTVYYANRPHAMWMRRLPWVAARTRRLQRDFDSMLLEVIDARLQEQQQLRQAKAGQQQLRQAKAGQQELRQAKAGQQELRQAKAGQQEGGAAAGEQQEAQQAAAAAAGGASSSTSRSGPSRDILSLALATSNAGGGQGLDKEDILSQVGGCREGSRGHSAVHWALACCWSCPAEMAAAACMGHLAAVPCAAQLRHLRLCQHLTSFCLACRRTCCCVYLLALTGLQHAGSEAHKPTCSCLARRWFCCIAGSS
jgi:hypothetical protein